jgi:serine O-acetyltransferase
VIALSVGDVGFVLLLQIALLLAIWLMISLIVYLGVRSRIEFDFKQDLLRKFDEKRGLPSGRDRLSLVYVSKVMLGDNCIQAVFLYRISSFLARHKLRTLAEILLAFSRFATHADLSPWATIAPGLYLYHGIGTVVGKGANIGKRALICQGVTIGGGATLGNDVRVWAGAQVLAGVTIGDRTEVGANAVVTTDFPADLILVGVPASIAPKKDIDPAEATAAHPPE